MWFARPSSPPSSPWCATTARRSSLYSLWAAESSKSRCTTRCAPASTAVMCAAVDGARIVVQVAVSVCAVAAAATDDFGAGEVRDDGGRRGPSPTPRMTARRRRHARGCAGSPSAAQSRHRATASSRASRPSCSPARSCSSWGRTSSSPRSIARPAREPARETVRIRRAFASPVTAALAEQMREARRWKWTKILVYAHYWIIAAVSLVVLAGTFTVVFLSWVRVQCTARTWERSTPCSTSSGSRCS